MVHFSHTFERQCLLLAIAKIADLQQTFALNKSFVLHCSIN